MPTKYYISSSKCSIHERQTKKGKVFDVMFRIITFDGIEKLKKLSGFTTKALAKQGHLEFITEHCELVKNNPIKKKDTSKVEPLIGDLLREYLASLSGDNKYSTIYDKTSVFKSYVLPYYENKKLKDLTVQELSSWVDTIWSLKNPKTNNFYSYNRLIKIRNHFNAFLNWTEYKYNNTNHLRIVPQKRKRSSKTEMKFWTRETFDKFISAVTEPVYHALFTFMFYTGRRKGELLALTPSDVTPTFIKINKSLTRKTLTDSSYEITSTKAEKKQTLPICKVVQDEIKRYEGGKPFYFGGEKPLSGSTIKRVFEAYCDKVGVERIRIHDLRHSFASMLIHLNGNMMVVADLIGDTVEQIMKTYGHLYQEDKLNVLSKI